MDPLQKLLYFPLDLFLPLGIGYLLQCKAPNHRRTGDLMMKLNLFLILPLTTCLSLWILQVNFQLIWLPFLGALMQLIPGLAAVVIAPKRFIHPHDRGSFLLSAFFANRSVVGILSVYVLYGEAGYGYGRLVMLFGGIVYYLFGFSLAGYFRELGDAESEKPPAFSKIIFNRNQIPVIGIAAGMLLNICSVTRPPLGGSAFPWLVHLSMWAFMIPIGWDLDLRAVWGHMRDVVVLLPIRFILTPAVIYLLACLIGLQGVTLNTVVVLSFTPAAIGAVIASKLYRLNTHLALAAFALTTVVYLVIIFPLLFWLTT